MMAARRGLTCREVVDFLADYLEGTLSTVERAAFDTHVHECPECEAYLHGYRDTVRLAREVARDPEAPVPSDVPEDLVRAIVAARPRRGSSSRGSGQQRRRR